MNPISSSFASAISATIKITEVLYQFQATDEQTSDILYTVNHVERNLKEAQRLLRQRDAVLDRKDYEWVASAIRDTRDTLQSVAMLTEPVRVEKMTKNEIGMMNRVCWAFKYNPQARDKHAVLNICHQTLLTVITRLHSIHPSTVPQILDQGTLLPPPPYDNNMEKLWTWRDQRRNRRRSATSLRHDNEAVLVILATTDRQELEVPSLESESYSTAQRGISAQEIKSYNTDYYPNYPDASPKPSTSHNQAFELPSRLTTPTAPYSLDEWPDASQSSISLPGSAIDLPSSGAHRTSTLPAHLSHETTTATLGTKLQMFEMSAGPPSPPQLKGKEIETPRKPPPRSIPSCLLPAAGNPPRSHSSAPTGSDSTFQSWHSAASASLEKQQPHTSTTQSSSIESHLARPTQSSFPVFRSELEAEAVIEPPSWAGSGACAGPSRPEIHDRVRSTGNRSEPSRNKYRGGSWLAYQTSLRGSTHGREGGGVYNV